MQMVNLENLRLGGRTARSLVLTALAAGALASCTRSISVPAPGAAPAPPLPVAEPSTISIPVRVDLTPMFAQAEQTVPKRFDAVESWTKIAEDPVGDVGAKYHIWRSPLRLSVDANRLAIQGDINYRFLIAHKVPLVGWKSIASCGWSEAARVASLRMETTVDWTKDWRLRSSTVVRPITFVNRCRITFLNIDITDYVREAFRERLDQASKEIDRQLAEQSDMQPYARRIWTQLQVPTDLGDGMWLLMAPQTATMSPPDGAGSSVTATVSITAQPQVVIGPRPDVRLQPLPALRSAAAGDGFHVTVDSRISFDEANRRLEQQLVGTRHVVVGHRVVIRGAHVYGSGSRAVLALEIDGDVKGRIYLIGTPAYDATRREVYIRGLDYSLETAHAIAGAADWLGHESFRGMIGDLARFPLDTMIATVGARIDSALNRPLADGVLSRGSISSIQPAGVYVTDDGFVARATIDGRMQVDIDMNAGGQR